MSVTNPASVLEIVDRALANVATFSHRLPADIARELAIAHDDVRRQIAPKPLPRLPLPDGPIRLGDGRELTVRDTQNDRLIAGRDVLVRSWTGPKIFGVAASSDLCPHGTLLHVSLSYPGHNPSWRDIRMVRDAFFPPDIDVMMVLPQQEDYVNVHQHCFHLWQMPVEWALR